MMQRALQHSRVQTQRHRGEKNKQLEGKLVNRVLDCSGYSYCSCFSQIPYSNYKISFYDFCIFNLFHCRSLTVDDLFFCMGLGLTSEKLFCTLYEMTFE